MKIFLKISLCTLMFISLSGCFSHKMNMRPRLLQDDAIPKLNIEYRVAIESVCDKKGQVEICSAGANTVNANLCEFTNVASTIMKNALQRTKITVVDIDKADKTLVFSLEKAYCSTWTGTAFVVLKVKTGNGLEKEFEGKKRPVASIYEQTRNFEIALHRIVKKIINDDEVLNYLKN